MTDEEFSWRWAYNEQLRLLDLHDARWIELSQGDWPDVELARFLRAYALVRGSLGQLVFADSNQVNRAQFHRTCKEVFQQKQNTVESIDLKHADRIWKDVIKAVQAEFGVAVRPFSAVSKLQWFYFPASWIMYDSLNRAALATWLKTKGYIKSKRDLSHDTFTERFEEFYKEEGQQGVIFASTFFSRKYPYNLRVAEKYLWLMGRKEEERAAILASYRASLKIAPDSFLCSEGVRSL